MPDTPLPSAAELSGRRIEQYRAHWDRSSDGAERLITFIGLYRAVVPTPGTGQNRDNP